MSSLGIDRLAAELESALSRLDGVRAAYLFGSAVASDAPQDVDVLVVYGPPLAPATAPSLEPLVQQVVALTCRLPAHLMFFSEAEAREPYLLAGLEPLVLLFGRPTA